MDENEEYDSEISDEPEESTLSFIRESPPSIPSASLSEPPSITLASLSEPPSMTSTTISDPGPVFQATVPIQNRPLTQGPINPNQAETLEIISRHVSSANLCRIILNKLEAIPLFDSMILSDLISSMASRSRPRRKIFIAILDNLQASNLFVYYQKKSSIVIRKGPRYRNN